MGSGHRAGFSFTEIVVILAIIGVISGIALGVYAQAQKGQEAKAGITSIRQIVAQGATAAASRGIPLELWRADNKLEVRTLEATPQVLHAVSVPSQLASQFPTGSAWLSYNSVGRVVLPSGFTNPQTFTSGNYSYQLSFSLIGEVKSVKQ
jgi:type II secretory pathway pseudopilin PulG